MTGTAQPSARIFVSYAHEDRELKQELDKHLKVLKRSSRVSVWSDKEIDASKEWNREIRRELESADLILLLVSVDFNASDFIWEHELAAAMERHEAGTAKVLPVVLRRCDWDSMPYAKLQAVPRSATPVTEFEDRDQAFTEIAEAIEGLVDEINLASGVG